MIRIGFDIDGVLADFHGGFIPFLGCQVPEGYFPGMWDYPQIELGLTSELVSSKWEEIKKSHNFWLKLDELPGAHSLYTFKHEHRTVPIEYYYVTSRPGDTALEQTKHWLNDHGLFEDGTVIVNSAKCAIANLLDFNFYLDDKLENCLGEYHNKPYLLNYPYNQTKDKHTEFQVYRINSVDEYLNDVRGYIERLG